MAHKIQLTLTQEETQLLSIRAKALGYSITKYVRFMIMKTAHEELMNKFPLFSMPAQLEEKTLLALEEHVGGKTRLLSSVDELDEL